jgi:hypothetical protein
MTEMTKSSRGYRVLHGNKLIPEVTKCTEPDETTAKTDNTSQDNLYGIKSRDAGWIDVGDMTLTINDTGGSLYADLKAIQRARTKEIWELAYAPVGCGRAIQGQAFISKCQHAHADDGGPQTISVTITPTSYFQDISVGAAGLTTPFLSVADEDSHAIALSPAAAGSVYDYELTAYTGSASVLVTPTAAAGSIYVQGVLVTSGAASAAIPISQTQGDITMVGIAVCEVNKASKTYLLRVKMGNAAYA